MIDYVRIFDTTLRDGEQAPGFSMTAGQKLRMAEKIAAMGADIIEAGFAAASPGDFDAIKGIAAHIDGPVICSLSRATSGDIHASGKAIAPAKRQRIHTFIATSPLHREYKLKMSKNEILDRAVAAVKLALEYTDDVEFSAEDAIRTERDYLKEVFEAVIEVGATTINVPDTVGYTTPEEIQDLFEYLSGIKGADKVILSTHCHNDLGLAVANSLAALRGGARQIEGALNGIGERAGNSAIEEIIMALKTRQDFFNVKMNNIATDQIYSASKLLSAITGNPVQRNKAIVGKNAFAHESGIHQHGILANRETYEIMKPEDIGISEENIILGKHSGRAALKSRAEKLGFTLADNQLQSVFVEFKKLADEKREVFDGDLEALILGQAVGAGGPWTLQSLYVAAGSDAGRQPEATARLIHEDGREETAVKTAAGPINAAFMAISAATDVPLKLEYFSAQSVTGGKDAMAESTVRVSTEFETYQGFGTSTDTILAGAKAYLDVINRIERRAVRQASIAAQH